jgi:hypothetical protein
MASEAVVDTNDMRLGSLPPRKLSAGECAIFLWARSSERKLVFFGTREGAGWAVIDGREVELKRISVDGREALGQFESQTFERPGYRLQLQVAFERREGLNRGMVVPQGTLRLKQDNGWEYILPVGGLLACEGS